ncbi:MAG TPA: PadR family transcriptional regulator [Phycicoccus sp.]|nr:PadR family transcriptional regulator [Phycicoccus sp.]
MASPRTATSYALLGLLAVRAWTTYELAKQVGRSLHWFWPRAERKLYDEPKQLVAAGLATASRERTGNRPRTVYAITEEGRAALRDWLSEPPAPPSMESEAVLKVFFSDAGSLEQLGATLDRMEEDSAARVDVLASMAGMPPAESEFPARLHLSALLLSLQLDQELATLRWTRWARHQVSAWRGTDDPGAWDPPAVLAALAERARREVPSRT